MTEDDDFHTHEARQRRKAERELDKKIAKGRSFRDRHLAADMTVDAVLHGVTVNWLSTVFSMSPKDIKARLADCPPLHRRQAGFVYDLKLAVRYLVKPVVDIEAYLKTMKIEELPTRLQTEYWGAKQKRLKYEEDAGHLWRTEAFMILVGELFQTIRTTSRLWADDVERISDLSEKQRAAITDRVDALLISLRDHILEISKKRAVKSILMEYLEEEAKEKAKEDEARKIAEEMEDDGFDPLSLI